MTQKNRTFSASKIIACAMFTLLLIQAPAFATNMIQPYKLVSAPTAEILPRSYLDVEINFYASRGVYGTGLIAGVHVGLTDRLMFGLAYGGEGLIGTSDNVYWYPPRNLGGMVKYRLFEEGAVPPAITIGFDNQGYGGPASTGEYGYDGYIFKAPGFFLAASKSYMMMNAVQVGFHGVLNYSIEGVDDTGWWPNLTAGMDIVINEELSIIAEYDMALNDISGSEKNSKRIANPLNGYFNIGLRWAFTENFHLQFDIRDIFENKTRLAPIPADLENRSPIGWSREMKVIYITKF